VAQTNPAAAVIIPTHNRADLLPTVLDAALAQTVPLEIFVMDDASSDGTADLVRQRYPGVHYHRQETSRGPTFQRNAGAALATAPILVTLDDDCVLASPRSIEQTLALFDTDRIGAVTIPYINVHRDRTLRHAAANRSGVEVTFDYFGGMIAFRRDVYTRIGGYREVLFMHVEESDLAIRLYDAGYVVRLGRADPIDHMESPRRNRARIEELSGRNHVLYAYFNVPWPWMGIHLAATTANCLWHGVRSGQPLRLLRGVLRGYGGIWKYRHQRRPVSGKTYRTSKRLRRALSMSLADMDHAEPG
jgi:glycosyltransferase involved in cell wall biosynthesis